MRSVFSDDTPEGRQFESGCLDLDDIIAFGFFYIDSVFNCSGGNAAGLSEPDD
ncbi:MAG: hypothetical protein AAFZ38_10510 [Myxococcota bacterium]